MRFHRPSHATVVAYLALLAALGGSAYAASRVGTQDLKPNAVTSAKIRNKNVKGPDVAVPIVRTVRHTAAPGEVALVVAHCKKNERLIGGGGGWDGTGTIRSSGPTTQDVPPAPATAYAVQGETAVANTLEARALCLPK
jgi:hypothetical protein